VDERVAPKTKIVLQLDREMPQKRSKSSLSGNSNGINFDEIKINKRDIDIGNEAQIARLKEENEELKARLKVVKTKSFDG